MLQVSNADKLVVPSVTQCPTLALSQCFLKIFFSFRLT